MLIHAKSLINLPIIESVSGQKVAFVENLVVDSDNGVVLALLLKKRNFFEKNKIISFRDVREIFLDGVIINSSDSIIDTVEIIKVHEVMDKNIYLIGSAVISQDGRRIGFLEDFIIDLSFGYLVTLVVKKRFGNEKRIISAERILDLLPGKIIIRDLLGRVETKKRTKALEPLLPV